MTTMLAHTLPGNAATASSSAVTASVVSLEPGLSPYRADWERLFASVAAQPSTSYEWMHALTSSHLQSQDRFALVKLARGNHTIGFVPLVAKRLTVMHCPVTLLTPMDEGHGTHSDLLAESVDEEVSRAFLTSLARLDVHWDVFRMSRLLDGHPLLEHATTVGRVRGLAASQVRAGDASYFLVLPATYEEYLAERSAKFRNHLKRTERRINAMDGVQVIERSSPGEVESAYDWLMEVERKSWKQGHGTAITAVNRQLRFYRELCSGAAAAGRLHLQFLALQNEPAAFNLGYISGGCYYYLKTSFAEQHRTLGVATYLRARLVEALIERGVRDLDFPAEPYEWERQWTTTVRWHKVLTVYRSTIAGRALSLIERFRHRDAGNATRVDHADPKSHRAPKSDEEAES